MLARSRVAPSSRRRLLAASAALLVILAGALALAQEHLLHEYFVIPASERPHEGPASTAAEPGSEANAAAFNEALAEGAPPSPDLALQPPPLTVTNQGEEAEFGPGSPAQSPSGEPLPEQNGPEDPDRAASLDRKTTLDQSLTYYAVFNPSVSPWKRATARNQIEPDYTLTVRSPRRRLEVRDAPVRAGFERFWGSMLVRMEAGRPISLPTVAAEIKLLRYQTEPPVELSFQHEYLADNYYVTGDFTGTVRLNFLLEAPSSYFGGAIDPQVRASDTPPQLRPQLPPALRDAAARAVTAIGVNPQGTLKEQLDALVQWFRSFEVREFPTDQVTRDVFLDLTLNKLGVCRHRAMAFVITAQSLGIAARYVHNEAHAFTEVYIPRRGWLRIDLGGAAVDFEMRNSDNKALHTPPEPDTLPQPDSFTSSYSHRVGSGQQEADINADGAPDPMGGVPEQTTAPRIRGADGPQDVPAPPDASPSEAETPGDPTGDPTGEPAATALDLPTPAAPPQDPDAPKRRATRLTLARPSGGEPSAFRGEPLVLKGRLVTDQDLPLQNHRVEAYLVPSNGSRRAEDLQRLGDGLTDADGRVTIQATLPPTLPLGLWSVYLFYPGDERFERVHSD